MKRNVLHLIPSFHQGGSESQAVQLAGLLASEGTHHIRLACLDRSGILLERARRSGFEAVPEFRLASFYDTNMLRQVRRFAKLLRSERIDVVQSHDFYTNIFGMLAARLAGVAIRIAAKRETGMRSRAQLFVERRSFGLATAVVANSDVVRKYLIGSGVSAKKIRVIHNGTDLGRFRPELEDRCEILRQFGISGQCPSQLVTIVANFRDPVKNHGMFLKAAAAVSKRQPGTAFVIAGEGELLERTKEMAAELGVGEMTHFIGRCERVPELLAVSSVCVLTSDSEGFSNSILEYMAAGKPVVATNVGGAAEAVVEGVNGFLVGPGDHASLAEQVYGLLRDRELSRSMGERGRQRVAEHYSTEAQLAGTLALYESEFQRIERPA